VLVETNFSPRTVLSEVQQIEHELGRIRKTEQYASRLIDIDLLFFDDLILKTPSLQLPHPRMAERRFVLGPLAEIAPDKLHPETNKTVAQMFAECPDGLKVFKLMK
jgi:2-amino-4-hydroxy-6-hydroxymethyldihydropteridine diphosphokinase